MSEIALYRRLFRQARPYWLYFSGLLVLGLLAAPIALLAPVPLKVVVDSVLGTRPPPAWLQAILPGSATATAAVTLLVAAAMLVAVTVLGQLRGLGSNILRTWVGERLVLDFRARLIDQVHHVSLSYHDSRGTADSIYRIQQDAPAIQNIMVDGVVPFISAVFTLVSMFVVIARLDGQLALVALAVSPPLFLLSGVYRPRLRHQSRRVKHLESSALAIVQETLGALRVVKAFGREEGEKGRLLQRLNEGVRARIRLALLEGGYGLLIGFVMSLGVAAILLVGVRHVGAGVLTLGQLLMVLSYAGQLYDPLKTMSTKVAGLQSHLASAERVFGLLDQRPEVTERPHARALERAAGALAFHGVSFRYEPGRPVLQEVSFEIQPGTRLGVVGASGAGKTTLISLLSRFYDPTAGQILLDGIDLRDYKLADLRRQFAVVPQEPVLFSVSIAENIAYARPGAGRDEIVAAAQAANAHEFIARLPRGYDTTVGERGAQLSGGQRQRIAIARAFLKDSPVLILDEPTSAIDPEGEVAIRGAMRHLMRGRTVILITHRPSMLEGCDSLVVLENGRVETEGRVPSTARPQVVAAVSGRCSHVASHPAVQAWGRLHPQREPRAITPLRVRRKKNQVYRLEGVGEGGGGVIAKRCPKPVAAVERAVYDGILPRLEVASLRHYGSLEESDSEYAWLFIEEASGSEYSNLLSEHRGRAARWLARVHTAAADGTAPPGLPDAGPARYLTLLRSIRDGLPQHLGNPVLSDDDVDFIERLQARLDDLEARWDRVEDVCAGLPQTLVHGDFNGKNIRLRTTRGDATILVFDWEYAGWGVPAVDLAQLAVPSGRLGANPDLPTYHATLRQRWPGVSLEACRRLACCGTLCRTLSALSWDAQHLAFDWAHGYVAGMRLYAAEMDQALERLGWNPTTRLALDPACSAGAPS